MRSTAYTLLAPLLLLTSLGTHASDSPGSRSRSPSPAAYDKAEALWPPSDVLKDYRRAADLYSAGRPEEGFTILRQAIARPLVLAPVGPVRKSERTGDSTYQMGRLMPTDTALRYLWDDNRKYAESVLTQGDRPRSLQILAVNALSAARVLHAEPHDTLLVIDSGGEWRRTLKRIGEVLWAAGNKSDASIAQDCRLRAKEFMLEQVRPTVDASAAQSDRLVKALDWLPESWGEKCSEVAMPQIINADIAQADRLIRLWDTEVDSPACRRLLRRLSEGKSIGVSAGHGHPVEGAAGARRRLRKP